MRRRLLSLLAYAIAIPIAAVFLFPYAWMLSGAFRRTRDVLSDPLRLWPEQFNLDVLADIARIGGAPLGGPPPGGTPPPGVRR